MDLDELRKRAKSGIDPDRPRQIPTGIPAWPKTVQLLWEKTSTNSDPFHIMYNMRVT